MIKPYLIRTPAYDHTSGGIKVMYGLYGWLLAKGIPAFLNAAANVPSVAIYPEIYDGNDMNGERVIRYILQQPGMMGRWENEQFITGAKEYKKDENLYVFSRVYDEWGVDDDHILFLPIIPLSMFYDQKKKRTKKAFYVGKGINLGNHPEDAIEITRRTAQDQSDLADLLNECQVLYVYDRMSAIGEVARLCGCAVQYYGELSKDQLSLYEPGLNGMGYKGEGVELDVNKFRQHYEELIKEFDRKLDIFIEDTQK